MTGRKVIPARLRTFRKDGLKLQARELAAKLGVSSSAVSSWEAGKTRMSGSAQLLFEGVFVAAGFEVEPTWRWLAGEADELSAQPPIIMQT